MSQLPLGMVFPFTQVFAYTAKGANEFILAAMVTGSALTSIVFAIPLGRLADKIGPQYVFIAFLGIDILIRMPLMICVSETLHLHFKAAGEEPGN